jgi:hypothetical protein
MKTIMAEVPADEISAFEVWLADASAGQGLIFGADAANNEDA